jgi:acetolactate synthase-1/2/3 large subunit
MNVAEYLLTIIQRLGTDTGFSLTGGMAMHFNRAAGESSLRMIYCNHEQAAAAAADGYAKAREFQTAGLVIVTSGPGVTNTVTSVASAYYDSVPMFIVAGQVKTADINAFGVRSRGAQETPHLDLMRPITKCAFRYVPDAVDDATLAANLAQALAGRKGTVFVEVPLDVQPRQVDAGEARVDQVVAHVQEILRNDRSTGGAAVATIRQALASAKRPVLVVGNGLRIAGVSRADIRALVERTGIPALFTWASFDLLPFDHPSHFGSAGGLAPTHSNRILQDADVVVFLGARLDLLTTAFNPQNYGKSAKRYVVECDQPEIEKNVGMPNTIFLRENVAGVADALLAQAGGMDVDPAWIGRCRQWRAEDRAEEAAAFGDRRLNTFQISRVLSASAQARYLVPTASGYATEGLARFYQPREGATFAWAGHTLGSMGLGLPTALGAAAGRHGAPVVCVEGDGGLLLNVQELFTLRANPDLPLTVIVLNNGGYQSIMQSQKRAFGKEFGASSESGLCTVQFELLAELAGLPYVRCDTLEEFEAVMSDPRAPSRRLIELLTVEDGYRGPSVRTMFDKNGTPYSTDIGDVTWAR